MIDCIEKDKRLQNDWCENEFDKTINGIVDPTISSSDGLPANAQLVT